MTTRVLTGAQAYRAPSGRQLPGRHPSYARPRRRPGERPARLRGRPARAHRRPRPGPVAGANPTGLARRFNARYGEVFTVPRGFAPAETARIKDLREPTAKMGKTGSDGAGVIFLLDDPDTVAAKVRRAVTDTEPALAYDPDARPGVANLATLLGALTGITPQDALTGLHGAAALKQAVTEALVETLLPIQKRNAELTDDPAEVQRLLRAGRDAVTPDALRTVAAAREAMGLLPVG